MMIIVNDIMHVSGNVAYSKKATARKVYAGMKAERAVDGNRDPNVENGKCFHHGYIESGDAWWIVNLGEQYVIYNMTVYGRSSAG